MADATSSSPKCLAACLQSLFRGAESKYGGMTEALEAHSLEGQKLEQRLAAAQEQYDAGLRKCIATAKQLSALQSRVRPPALPPACMPARAVMEAGTHAQKVRLRRI